jgi:hypothetical protein
VKKVVFLIKEDCGMVFKLKVYLMLLMLVFVTSTGLASSEKREEKTVKNVWKQYVDYWKKHDKDFKPSSGDSQKDIMEVEKFFHKELPKSLSISLNLYYHYSRRGKNGLRYSWFGDLIEINFLTSKMMIEEYRKFLQNMEINEDGIKNIYIGDIKPYTKKGWPKDWIPILVRYDVELTLFLDLRNDSNHYGQVLALWYYQETDKDGFHNRFAYISDSYEAFMKEAFEYMKANKGLDNKYFLEKLDLPLFYWK